MRTARCCAFVVTYVEGFLRILCALGFALGLKFFHNSLIPVQHGDDSLIDLTFTDDRFWYWILWTTFNLFCLWQVVGVLTLFYTDDIDRIWWPYLIPAPLFILCSILLVDIVPWLFSISPTPFWYQIGHGCVFIVFAVYTLIRFTNRSILFHLKERRKKLNSVTSLNQQQIVPQIWSTEINKSTLQQAISMETRRAQKYNLCSLLLSKLGCRKYLRGRHIRRHFTTHPIRINVRHSSAFQTNPVGVQQRSSQMETLEEPLDVSSVTPQRLITPNVHARRRSSVASTMGSNRSTSSLYNNSQRLDYHVHTTSANLGEAKSNQRQTYNQNDTSEKHLSTSDDKVSHIPALGHAKEPSKTSIRNNTINSLGTMSRHTIDQFATHRGQIISDNQIIKTSNSIPHTLQRMIRILKIRRGLVLGLAITSITASYMSFALFFAWLSRWSTDSPMLQVISAFVYSAVSFLMRGVFSEWLFSCAIQGFPRRFRYLAAKFARAYRCICCIRRSATSTQTASVAQNDHTFGPNIQSNSSILISRSVSRFGSSPRIVPLSAEATTIAHQPAKDLKAHTNTKIAEYSNPNTTTSTLNKRKSWTSNCNQDNPSHWNSTKVLSIVPSFNKQNTNSSMNLPSTLNHTPYQTKTQLEENGFVPSLSLKKPSNTNRFRRLLSRKKHGRNVPPGKQESFTSGVWDWNTNTSAGVFLPLFFELFAELFMSSLTPVVRPRWVFWLSITFEALSIYLVNVAWAFPFTQRFMPGTPAFFIWKNSRELRQSVRVPTTSMIQTNTNSGQLPDSHDQTKDQISSNPESVSAYYKGFPRIRDDNTHKTQSSLISHIQDTRTIEDIRTAEDGGTPTDMRTIYHDPISMSSRSQPLVKLPCKSSISQSSYDGTHLPIQQTRDRTLDTNRASNNTLLVRPLSKESHGQYDTRIDEISFPASLPQSNSTVSALSLESHTQDNSHGSARVSAHALESHTQANSHGSAHASALESQQASLNASASVSAHALESKQSSSNASASVSAHAVQQAISRACASDSTSSNLQDNTYVKASNHIVHEQKQRNAYDTSQLNKSTRPSLSQQFNFGGHSGLAALGDYSTSQEIYWAQRRQSLQEPLMHTKDDIEYANIKRHSMDTTEQSIEKYSTLPPNASTQIVSNNRQMPNVSFLTPAPLGIPKIPFLGETATSFGDSATSNILYDANASNTYQSAPNLSVERTHAMNLSNSFRIPVNTFKNPHQTVSTTDLPNHINNQGNKGENLVSTILKSTEYATPLINDDTYRSLELDRNHIETKTTKPISVENGQATVINPFSLNQIHSKDVSFRYSQPHSEIHPPSNTNRSEIHSPTSTNLDTLPTMQQSYKSVSHRHRRNLSTDARIGIKSMGNHPLMTGIGHSSDVIFQKANLPTHQRPDIDTLTAQNYASHTHTSRHLSHGNNTGNSTNQRSTVRHRSLSPRTGAMYKNQDLTSPFERESMHTFDSAGVCASVSSNGMMDGKALNGLFAFSKKERRMTHRESVATIQALLDSGWIPPSNNSPRAEHTEIPNQHHSQANLPTYQKSTRHSMISPRHSIQPSIVLRGKRNTKLEKGSLPTSRTNLLRASPRSEAPSRTHHFSFDDDEIVDTKREVLRSRSLHRTSITTTRTKSTQSQALSPEIGLYSTASWCSDDRLDTKRKTKQQTFQTPPARLSQKAYKQNFRQQLSNKYIGKSTVVVKSKHTKSNTSFHANEPIVLPMNSNLSGGQSESGLSDKNSDTMLSSMKHDDWTMDDTNHERLSVVSGWHMNQRISSVPQLLAPPPKLHTGAATRSKQDFTSPTMDKQDNLVNRKRPVNRKLSLYNSGSFSNGSHKVLPTTSQHEAWKQNENNPYYGPRSSVHVQNENSPYYGPKSSAHIHVHDQWEHQRRDAYRRPRYSHSLASDHSSVSSQVSLRSADSIDAMDMANVCDLNKHESFEIERDLTEALYEHAAEWSGSFLSHTDLTKITHDSDRHSIEKLDISMSRQPGIVDDVNFYDRTNSGASSSEWQTDGEECTSEMDDFISPCRPLSAPILRSNSFIGSTNNSDSNLFAKSEHETADGIYRRTHSFNEVMLHQHIGERLLDPALVYSIRMGVGLCSDMYTDPYTIDAYSNRNYMNDYIANSNYYRPKDDMISGYTNNVALDQLRMHAHLLSRRYVAKREFSNCCMGSYTNTLIQSNQHPQWIVERVQRLFTQLLAEICAPILYSILVVYARSEFFQNSNAFPFHALPSDLVDQILLNNGYTVIFFLTALVACTLLIHALYRINMISAGLDLFMKPRYLLGFAMTMAVVLFLNDTFIIRPVYTSVEWEQLLERYKS